MEKNNISTYATWIAIAIASILAYFGIEYDYTAILPIVTGIITLAIAIYSSKHPNEIEWLGNKPTPNTIDAEEPILNEEYITTEEEDDEDAEY